MSPDGGKVSRYSILNSQSSLIHSVQPSDCAFTGYVQGGVTMKMMDEVAGIVAFRHCKTNVVTASIGKIKTKKTKTLANIIACTCSITGDCSTNHFVYSIPTSAFHTYQETTNQNLL